MIRSRLFFSCDSAEQAAALIASTQVELDRARANEFPTIAVNDCCGLRTIELRPHWLRRAVARARPDALTMQVSQEQVGRIHRLTIEIGD